MNNKIRIQKEYDISVTWPIDQRTIPWLRSHIRWGPRSTAVRTLQSSSVDISGLELTGVSQRQNTSIVFLHLTCVQILVKPVCTPHSSHSSKLTTLKHKIIVRRLYRRDCQSLLYKSWQWQALDLPSGVIEGNKAFAVTFVYVAVRSHSLRIRSMLPFTQDWAVYYIQNKCKIRYSVLSLQWAWSRRLNVFENAVFHAGWFSDGSCHFGHP